MTGKHTIFDTRRQARDDSHAISPNPPRPDGSNPHGNSPAVAVFTSARAASAQANLPSARYLLRV